MAPNLSPGCSEILLSRPTMPNHGQPHPRLTISKAKNLYYSRIFDQKYIVRMQQTADKYAIFKKGDTGLPKTTNPFISHLCALKIMEHVLYHSIMAHFDKNNILINSQHGFHAKHSCESQLLSIVGSLSRSLKKHKQTNVLILDFSKVFDTDF